MSFQHNALYIKTIGDEQPPENFNFEEELDEQEQIYYNCSVRKADINSQKEDSKNRRLSMPSQLNCTLTKLMGSKSPKEFAKELVYGGATVGKNKENQAKKSASKQQIQLQEIINRLSSPIRSERKFGGEFCSNTNKIAQDLVVSQANVKPVQQTPYTTMSFQIKENLEQQKENNLSNSRLFSPSSKKEPLLLSTPSQQMYYANGGLQKQQSPNQSIDPYALQQRQLDASQRLATEGQIFRQNRQTLLQKYEADVLLKECTFKPQTNIPQEELATAVNVNINECFSKFAELQQRRQETFITKINLRRTEIEDQATKQLQEKPSISKKSKFLAESHYSRLQKRNSNQKKGFNQNNQSCNFSVVDRLYVLPERCKDDATNQKETEQAPVRLFSPQIQVRSQTLQRDQKVDQILYQDALRRQRNKQQLQELFQLQKQQQSALCQFTVFNKMAPSKKTLLATIAHFAKEFKQAIQFAQPESQEGSAVLTYSEMAGVLLQLHFLPPLREGQDWAVYQPVINSGNNTAALAQLIFCQLNGVQNRTVLKKNLLIFLLAVMNIQVTTKEQLNIIEQVLQIDQIQSQISHLTPIDRCDDNLIYQNNNEFSESPIQSQKQIAEEAVNSSNFSAGFHSARISQQNPQVSGKQQQQSQQNAGIQEKTQKTNNRIPTVQQQKLTIIDISPIREAELIQQMLQAQPVRQIGQFDSNLNIVFTEQQVRVVHQTYNILCINRLSYEKIDNTKEGNFDDSSSLSFCQNGSLAFKPQLSSTSQQIAQQRREKILDQIKTAQPGIVHIDLCSVLSYQQHLSDVDKEKLRKKQEEECQKQCPFKPVTNDFTVIQAQLQLNSTQKKQIASSNDLEDNLFKQQGSDIKKIITTPRSIGVRRTEELYKLARPLNQKRDKNRIDIEYERECDQCTFAPDITDSICSKQNIVQPPASIKAIDKQITRVKQARINQELIVNIKSTGSTTNKQKLQQLQQKISQQSSKTQEHRHEKRLQPCYTQNADSAKKDSNYGVIQEETTQRNQESTSRSNELCNNTQNQQPNSSDDEKDKNKTCARTVDDDRVPLLFVDVNIEEGKTARIVVYEGEKSEELANRFAQQHNLDMSMKERLKDLLDQQINSLLTKIDEEAASEVSSQKHEENQI